MASIEFANATAGVIPVLVLTKFVAIGRHSPTRDRQTAGRLSLPASEKLANVIHGVGLALAAFGELVALRTLAAGNPIGWDWVMWLALVVGFVILIVDLLAPWWADRLTKRWDERG